MRKSQIDRDPPRLLFGKTIGVDAGQSLNQPSLAVIDVSGRSDEHVFDFGNGGHGVGSLLVGEYDIVKGMEQDPIECFLHLRRSESVVQERRSIGPASPQREAGLNRFLALPVQRCTISSVPSW